MQVSPSSEIIELNQILALNAVPTHVPDIVEVAVQQIVQPDLQDGVMDLHTTPSTIGPIVSAVAVPTSLDKQQQQQLANDSTAESTISADDQITPDQQINNNIIG